MADIFLSYAREDLAKANLIASELRARGWTVWWDREIPQGTNFREHIAGQLRAARCVVVLWSESSVASSFVCDEADDALNGRLISVLVERVAPPLGFRQLQTADLCGWNGASDHPEWRRVITSIRALFHGLPTHEQGARVFQLDTTRKLDRGVFSPDGKRVLSAGHTEVRVFNVEAGECLHQLSGHRHPAWALAWASDQSFALSCGLDGDLKVWNAETGDLLREFTVGEVGVMVSLSADDRRAVFAGVGSSSDVQIWDVAIGKRLASFADIATHCTAVAWTADERFILSGDVDAAVRVLNAESQKCEFTLEARRFKATFWHAILDPVVTCIRASTSGDRVLCGYSNGTVRVWDLKTRQCLWVSWHEKRVTTVLWAGDGRFALSGSDDKTVRVWNIESGKLHQRFSGHKGHILAIAWLSSFRCYASLDVLGSIRMWEISEEEASERASPSPH